MANRPGQCSSPPTWPSARSGSWASIPPATPTNCPNSPRRPASGSACWGPTGPWLTAEAAERGRLAAFGGLPRAFANAIVRQGAYGEGTQVVGLILRPLSALRLTAQQGADLDRGLRVLAPPGSPQFAAGIEAGFEANGAPGFGAADRFARARANYLAALTEQKREGNPGTAFPVVPWKWQRYLPGESAPVPFRVTGVIW